MARRKADIRAYSARQLEKLGCGEASGIRKAATRNGFKSITGIVAGNKTKLYLFDFLPCDWKTKIEAHEVREKLREHGVETDAPFDPDTVEHSAALYADAPEYNRRMFDKYANILQLSEALEGQKLKDWIEQWNREHPEIKTSYPSVMRARKEVRERGQGALIGNYGKSTGRSTVPDQAFEYFKSLYLKEGAPGGASCWLTTFGKFCNTGVPGYIDIKDFPTEDSFMRRLLREVGESAIYLAREGWSKWNRKYNQYIERDYTKIKAGQVWVSDHAQVDVATKSGKNGKPVFGWITSFVDMKTSKALSCFYHEEPPNSDHIFVAFYMAAVVHGLPEYLYIDNGKDYRCNDFAGGRKIHRVQVDEVKTTSMLAALGVGPIFAKPYNAQSKTIERWHLKIKEALSKHAEGYRGGNVTERPERLAEDIKRGNILDFSVFKEILLDFIFNFLNQMPSQGKGCNGLPPDDAWNKENPVKRTVTREALKLFCMRTSQPLTIRRNGIEYSKFGVNYFAEWMIPLKGTKVYLRIAPDNVNDAWVFALGTDEYLGNAQIKGLTHPVAESEIDKADLRAAIASKAREEKAAKSLGYVRHTPDTAERLSHMKTAVTLLNPEPVPEPERNVTHILPNSSMQQAVNARNKRKQEGKSDLSALAKATEISAKKRELASVKGKILHFESDKPVRDARIRELEAEIVRLQAMGQ